MFHSCSFTLILFFHDVLRFCNTFHSDMDLKSISKIHFHTLILAPISSKQSLELPRKGKKVRKREKKGRQMGRKEGKRDRR